MHYSALAETIEGQSHLLCRAYRMITFQSLCVAMAGRNCNKEISLRWALGLLSDGQPEVLGIWHRSSFDGSAWEEIVLDLKARGLQRIRLACCDASQAIHAPLRSAFPGVSVLSRSKHAGAADNRFLTWNDSTDELARDVRRIVRVGNEVATSFGRVARYTIGRHGPVSDFASALRLGLRSLQTAERKALRLATGR